MADSHSTGPWPESSEVERLLASILAGYGFDFRGYARPSLRRRIGAQVRAEGAGGLAQYAERVAADKGCFQRLVRALSETSTSLFRQPRFYADLREKVIPNLRTWPSINVWHPNCSSGEQVYSTAIVLREEGLLEKARIYATDFSEDVLEQARRGVYPLESYEAGEANYRTAGGTATFAEYCTRDGEAVSVRPLLRERVVFAAHNLATDSSINEFHLIVCRDVMIYFDRALQERVFGLLHESLCRFGVLGLGAGESLRASPLRDLYEPLPGTTSLFRRIA